MHAGLPSMFWHSTSDIVRLIIVAPIAYVALVVVLRVSGKRMLSKMSAFDLVVTIALGSTLATILLSKDVAVVEGVTVFVLLIGLQYAVAWSTARSRRFGHVIKSEPRLVFFRGRFIDEALRRENLAGSEVLAAIRKQGVGALSAVTAVILEADGTLSVITGPAGAGVLGGVANFPAGERG